MSAALDFGGDHCALLPAVGLAYREKDTFYAGLDVAAFTERLAKPGRGGERSCQSTTYPAPSGPALDEIQALRFCRSFFQRNYETLKEAKPEELRLHILLAEIGCRLYGLSDNEGDYKRQLPSSAEPCSA